MSAQPLLKSAHIELPSLAKSHRVRDEPGTPLEEIFEEERAPYLGDPHRGPALPDPYSPPVHVDPHRARVPDPHREPVALEPHSHLTPGMISSRETPGYEGQAPQEDESEDGAETQVRLLAWFGITAPLGEDFECVLADHDHTARFFRSAEQKRWVYRCETGAGRGLGEIRALYAYRDERSVSDAEALCWRTRLSWEAGLIDNQPEPFVVEGASKGTQTVAHGLSLFLMLRPKRWDRQPFLFAREFAAAWCRTSTETVKRAMRELERRGVIERAGKRKLAILWTLPEWEAVRS